MSVQRFVINRDNYLLRDSTIIDADSVEPVSGTTVLKEFSKKGSGSVRLTGTYVGHKDCDIEIEIVDETSSTPVISKPIFSGVGNGEIRDISVSGLPSQTFTIELTDLGTRTTYAKYDLAGVKLRSKKPGSAGNSIFITVDRSKIRKAFSGFISHKSINEGSAVLGGAEWDFGGAYPLNADGELHDDTARITFGGTIYPVYREYIEHEQGSPVYKLTPVPVQSYKAGTRVYFVTGTYTVIIQDKSNGATEKYTNIITLYDLLLAIQSQSNILAVDGIIANDKTPGGQNAVDLPLITEAYLSELITTGSQYVSALLSSDISLSLFDKQAKTDTITIRCRDNTIVGGEVWDVISTRGAKAIATTGKVFSSSNFPVTFLIPPQDPPENERSIRVRTIQYAPREEGETVPPICIDLLTLGAAAKTSTIILTYRIPPEVADECECKNVEYDGELKRECLGVDVDNLLTKEGGDEILNWRQQKIMADIYAWKDSFIRNNTNVTAGTGTFQKEASDVLQKYTAILKTDRVDIRIAEYIVALFHDALKKVATEFGLPYVWSPEAEFTIGQRVYPTTANGYYYECIQAGTTGTSEPAWTTNWGDKISDGTVVWECRGNDPYSLAESLFAQVQTDMSVLDDVNGGDFWRLMNVQFKTHDTYNDFERWGRRDSYAPGDPVVPISPNGYYYVCIDGGHRGSSEPVWPTTIGDTVEDYGVIWRCEGTTTTYEIVDEEGFADTVDAHINDWLRRYRAEAERILIAAQVEPEYLLPNFNQANTDDVSDNAGGGLCWQAPDPGSPYWEINNGEYLPAVTNVVYHSCKNASCSSNGEIIPEPTREFALVIKVKCEDLLKDGDTIIIDIEAGNRRTYQVGDEIQFTIFGNAPARLSGGVDGTDTLTWRVSGSESGEFPPYILDLDDPQQYDNNGLSFAIDPGAIAFQLGDKWVFRVSGYQFRWRKDEGPWNGPLDVADSVALVDGLVAEFIAGADFSYRVGDYFLFRVYQPNSYTHVLHPDWQWWKWIDTTALSADFGIEQDIDTIVLVCEFLNTGSVSLKLSNDASFATLAWTGSINITPDRKLYVVRPDCSARYFRLDIPTGINGKILWLYVGPSIALSVDSQQVAIRRRYVLPGGDKLYLTRAGTLRGSGYGGEIAWDNWLSPDDVAVLISMLDYLKLAGDEPFVFIPHLYYPEDSFLARVTNEVQIEDLYRFQVDDKAQRKISARLPLREVVF